MTRKPISDKTAWRLADLSGLIILAITVAIAFMAFLAWQAGVLP